MNYVTPRTPAPKKGALHLCILLFLFALELPICAAMAAS